MKKFRLGFILTILFFSACSLFFRSVFYTGNAEDENFGGRDVKDVLGVTTAGGYYEFDPMVSCLEDGANKIYDLGSRVIKLWLTTSSMGTSYAYNVDWSGYDISNCVDLLNSSPYRNVLSKDFSTIIFETHTFDYGEEIKEVVWNDGVSDSEYARIKSEMYQLSKYLLREYNGTGKTFVLQNWEGDNMLGTNFIRKNAAGYYYDTRTAGANEAGASTDSTVKKKIKGFTDWMNARQAGVDQAIKEAGKFTDVKVLNAMEINFIYIEEMDAAPYPYPDSPILLDTVVPFTDCDLYSYSNWQSAYMNKVDSLNDRLRKYHEKIGDTYTDAEGNVKYRRPMARNGQTTKVMLGEYGTAEYFQPNGSAFVEKHDERTDLLHYSVIRAETEIALDFGCEYVLLWQLYCNELQNGNEVNQAIGEEAEDPSQMRGYWLIRPDGSFTSAYRYFDCLYAPEKLLYNGAAPVAPAKINGTAGQAVISTTRVSGELPANNNSIYGSELKFYGSRDGDNYEEIELYSYDTVIKAVAEEYVYRVNYVSVPDISDYSYFKVESDSPVLTVEKMQIYPQLHEDLMRFKIAGVREGGTEKSYLTSYTLESGETVVLTPEFNREFNGNVSYYSTNRYIVEIDKNGAVLGKVNGSASIIITVSGGELEKEYTATVNITVMGLGEEILHDSFIGYKTVAYSDDDAKKVGTELAGFGNVLFDEGVQAKYFEQFNMQFYRLDVEEKRPELEFFKDVFSNTSIAYILDWNNYGYCYVTYRTDKDIGGYGIELNTYGLNAMAALQVYVSGDNENWIAVSSALIDSRAIGLGYYYNKLVNRQILPSGMRFIRIRLSYVDSNRWNPQMYDVKIYGESKIAKAEYIDPIAPVINVKGDIKDNNYLGEQIKIPEAEISDNYSTEKELYENYSVKAYYFMDGSFFEVGINGSAVDLTVEAIYKIEYSVYDLAGNRAVKNYYVQAIRKPDETVKKRSCKSSADATSVSCMALFALYSAVKLLKYKKEKTNRTCK